MEKSHLLVAGLKFHPQHLNSVVKAISSMIAVDLSFLGIHRYFHYKCIFVSTFHFQSDYENMIVQSFTFQGQEKVSCTKSQSIHSNWCRSICLSQKDTSYCQTHRASKCDSQWKNSPTSYCKYPGIYFFYMFNINKTFSALVLKCISLSSYEIDYC